MVAYVNRRPDDVTRQRVLELFRMEFSRWHTRILPDKRSLTLFTRNVVCGKQDVNTVAKIWKVMDFSLVSNALADDILPLTLRTSLQIVSWLDRKIKVVLHIFGREIDGFFQIKKKTGKLEGICIHLSLLGGSFNYRGYRCFLYHFTCQEQTLVLSF